MCVIYWYRWIRLNHENFAAPTQTSDWLFWDDMSIEPVWINWIFLSRNYLILLQNWHYLLFILYCWGRGVAKFDNCIFVYIVFKIRYVEITIDLFARIDLYGVFVGDGHCFSHWRSQQKKRICDTGFDLFVLRCSDKGQEKDADQEK